MFETKLENRRKKEPTTQSRFKLKMNAFEDDVVLFTIPSNWYTPFTTSPNPLSVIQNNSKHNRLLHLLPSHQGGLRVFLGALIHVVPAMANLHNALTCSGKAYSIPTRGPTRMFSGSGASRSSKPPKHIHAYIITTVNFPIGCKKHGNDGYRECKAGG